MADEIGKNDEAVCKIPPLLDGKFFKIASEIGDKVVAKCVNCVNKSISGSRRATTNFLRHLKTKHPTLITQYNEYRINMSTSKRKGSGSPSSRVPQKKLKFQTLFPVSLPTSVVSQKEVNLLLTNYIIEGMCPLRTVEMPSFVALVAGLAPSVTVMTKKTLSEHIKIKYESMLSVLKGKLSTTDFVCTTADIWTTGNRSYMGMTVHWITPDLVRKSAALACRRFTGSHNFHCIAEIIDECLGQFDLDTSKVVSTVTDNANNFKEAFIEFHASDEDNKDEVEEDEMTYVNVDEILNTGADCDSETLLIQLPRHVKCVCHMLNLVATTDAEKAMTIPDSVYGRMSHSSFGKCWAIWNSVSRSSQASDAVAAICDGQELKVPCPNWWNSKFDSVSKLLRASNKLGLICDVLKLPKLVRAEVDFLKEYCRTMEPFACTLEQLKHDNDCFFGMLLPKLIQLRLKMNRILNDNLQYCRPLVAALLTGIGSRFKNYLALDLSDMAVQEAVLASVSHPMYKLKWVPPELRDEVSKCFFKAMIGMNTIPKPTRTDEFGGKRIELLCDNEDYGYFEDQSTLNDSGTTNNANSIRIQMINYLSDTNSTFATLQSSELIKKVFIRYNTTLPSSAPVQRLFSSAELIEAPI